MKKILIDVEQIKELMNNINNILINNNNIIHNINNKDSVLSNLEINSRELKIIQENFMNMTLIKFSEIIKGIGFKINITNDIQIESIYLDVMKSFILNIISNNKTINYINITLNKNNSTLILLFESDQNLNINFDLNDLNVIKENNNIKIIIEQSISVIETLEICIGKYIYLLPIDYMVESLQPTKDMIKIIGDGSKELLMLRDEFIPILRLYKFFNIENNCNDNLLNGILIVTKYNNQKIALFVDKFLQQVQSSIKPLKDNYIDTKGISATAIRGNNEVSYVLDLNSIIQNGEKK